MNLGSCFRPHTSHLFIFDREVDFLVRWPGSRGGGGVHTHYLAPVWWCMLHSPQVATLCKYQVYMQYSIRCTSTAVHRDAEVFVCFSRATYANMTPFFISKSISLHYENTMLLIFNFDHIFWLENTVGICLHRDSLWIYTYFCVNGGLMLIPRFIFRSTDKLNIPCCSLIYKPYKLPS